MWKSIQSVQLEIGLQPGKDFLLQHFKPKAISLLYQEGYDMVNIIYQLFSFFFPLVIIGLLVLIVYLRGRTKNRTIKNTILPGLKKALTRYVDSPLEDTELNANQWVLDPRPKPSTGLKELEVSIQLTQRQVFFALLSNKLMGNQDFLIFEGTLAKGKGGLVVEIIPRKEQKIIEKNYKYLIELEDLNLGGSKKLEELFMQKGDNVKRARRIFGERELLTRLLKAEEYLLWLTISKDAPQLRAVYRINEAFNAENACRFTLDLAARINT